MAKSTDLFTMILLTIENYYEIAKFLGKPLIYHYFKIIKITQFKFNQ